MTNPIQQAVELIRQSKQLTVLTGAGVSKESGVPTFRDALNGLWARYDPQQLATPLAFMENPKLVWDWYDYRRGLVGEAQPNPGHFALTALQQRFPQMIVVTQNVDDLHERAGTRQVIHLHGRIAETRCCDNCRGNPTLVDLSALHWDRDSGPPPCPHCGKLLRPNVVWFGEMLPREALQDAFTACEATDLMLVIGTSGVVQPAASMPLIAKRHGATIIEFNPVESEITPMADLWLQGPSGEMLPRVMEALNLRTWR